VVAAAGSELHDLLNLNVQRFQLLTDSVLRHPLAQILYQQSHTVWKLTHFPPSKERWALTVTRNPSAVDGTTISFSAFSWAVKSLGQDARNHAIKALLSVTPEIKMGVLLRRCPQGTQVLDTWVFSVVPIGAPLRSPDISLYMPLVAVSEETAGSDESKPLTVSLSGPLGFCGATGAATTASYIIPPSGDSSYRSPEATCSPVASD
jgi:hypothetical protein